MNHVSAQGVDERMINVHIIIIIINTIIIIVPLLCHRPVFCHCPPATTKDLVYHRLGRLVSLLSLPFGIQFGTERQSVVTLGNGKRQQRNFK